MTTYTAGSGRPLEDPVSNVLKWVLLAVAVGSFALFAWATLLTYERAAPQPDRFVAAGGGDPDDGRRHRRRQSQFQKADLMITGASMGWAPISGRTTPPSPWCASPN